MFIAKSLGKFEHEIRELPPSDFIRWVAYFRLEERERARASRQAALKSNIKPGINKARRGRR